MKFGKRLKELQVPGWVYLDYKALKQVIKQLFGPLSPGHKESAEQEFKQELYNGIQAVNAFFVDKERQLLSALALHGGGGGALSAAEAKDAFFGEVAELHASCILNYLAIIKIVKKHDKHSCDSVAPSVYEHTFSQAFYLSLEHSYLYSACRSYLTDAHARCAAGAHSAATIPFERCLIGAGLISVHPELGPIDFAALRRRDAPGSDQVEGQSRAVEKQSRAVEMQLEALVGLSRATTPRGRSPRPILGRPLAESLDETCERRALALGAEGHAAKGDGMSSGAGCVVLGSAPSAPLPCARSVDWSAEERPEVVVRPEAVRGRQRGAVWWAESSSEVATGGSTAGGLSGSGARRAEVGGVMRGASVSWGAPVVVEVEAKLAGAALSDIEGIFDIE